MEDCQDMLSCYLTALHANYIYHLLSRCKAFGFFTSCLESAAKDSKVQDSLPGFNTTLNKDDIIFRL